MSFYVDYPYRVGAAGRTATTDWADHVRDMIEQLLFTRPGERLNRPDFGCGLQDQVFEPNSSQLAAVLQVSVEAALHAWLGDVIRVDSLDVVTEDSTLTVQLGYRLLATGEQQAAVIGGSTRP